MAIRRFLAFLLDTAILFVVYMILFFGIGMLVFKIENTVSALPQVLFFLFFFTLYIFYFVFFHYRYGRTIGKRAIGIKAISEAKSTGIIYLIILAVKYFIFRFLLYVVGFLINVPVGLFILLVYGVADVSYMIRKADDLTFADRIFKTKIIEV